MNRLALALVLFIAAPARADVAPAPERRLFARFGAGAAFDYESWHPDGGAPGASYTGWGPALDVTVGRFALELRFPQRLHGPKRGGRSYEIDIKRAWWHRPSPADNGARVRGGGGCLRGQSRRAR